MFKGIKRNLISVVLVMLVTAGFVSFAFQFKILDFYSQTNKVTLEVDHYIQLLNSALARIQLLSEEGNEEENTRALVEINQKLSTLTKELKSYHQKSSIYMLSPYAILLDKKYRIDDYLTHFQLVLNDYLTKRDDKSYQYFFDNKNYSRDVKETLIALEKIQENLIQHQKDLLTFTERNQMFGFFNIIIFFAFFVNFFVRPLRRLASFLRKERTRIDRLIKGTNEMYDVYLWEYDLKEDVVRKSEYLCNILITKVHTTLEEELSLMDEQARKKFQKVMNHLKTGAQVNSFECEVSYQLKNGKRFWFSFQGNNLSSDDLRIVLSAKEITTKKLADHRYRFLFEESPLPMIAFNEREVIKANKAMSDFLGFRSKDDLLEKHPATFFPMFQENDKSSWEEVQKLFQVNIVSNESLKKNWHFKSYDRSLHKAFCQFFKLPFDKGDFYLIQVLETCNELGLEKRALKHTQQIYKLRRENAELVSEFQKILAANPTIKLPESNAIKDSLKECVESHNYLKPFDLEEVLLKVKNRWKFECQKRDVKLNFALANSRFESYWGEIGKVERTLNDLVKRALIFTQDSEILLEVHTEARGRYRDAVWFNFESDWREVNEQEVSDESRLYQQFENVESIENLGNQRQKLLSSCKELMTNLKSTHNQETERELVSFGVEFDGVDLNNARSGGDDVFALRKMTSSILWEYFEGDHQLMDTLIHDFCEYYPDALVDIEDAILTRDLEQLYLVTSNLYSVMCYFPHFKGIERVIALQKMSIISDFDDAYECWKLLVEDLKQLQEIFDATDRSKKVSA